MCCFIIPPGKRFLRLAMISFTAILDTVKKHDVDGKGVTVTQH